MNRRLRAHSGRSAEHDDQRTALDLTDKPAGEWWAAWTNERYRREVAKRRQSFEQRQRWLFDHRDREVRYGERRYVIRIRRRYRSFQDAGVLWAQWLFHGLRNLAGDMARLLLRRSSHWTIGIFEPDHLLGPRRLLHVTHCPSEGEAIVEADRLSEEVARRGPP